MTRIKSDTTMKSAENYGPKAIHYIFVMQFHESPKPQSVVMWNAFPAAHKQPTSDSVQSNRVHGKKTAAHKRPASDSVRSDRVRGKKNCGTQAAHFGTQSEVIGSRGKKNCGTQAAHFGLS